MNQENRKTGNKAKPSDSFSGTTGSCFPDSHPPKSKLGRPRKDNPSPDAIRMRKVYDARSAAGISTNPSTQKRSLAARSVRNHRGKKSFGYMGKKAHAFGVFADRLYSRPIMRVGCHVPNL